MQKRVYEKQNSQDDLTSSGRTVTASEYVNPDVENQQKLNDEIRMSYDEKAPPRLHMPRFQANYRPSEQIRR